MSDFDKEAERERLREKYGEDEADREATEQMSELLLKGATMTNAHCDNCGDPIFRYDGQEFCPSCQRPVDRGEASDEGASDDGDNIEVTTPSEDATVQFGDQSADDSAHQAADGSSGPQPAVDDAASRRQSADSTAGGQQPRAGQASPERTDDRTPPQQVDSPEPAPEQSADRTRSAPSPDRASTATETAASGAVGEYLTHAQRLLAQTIEEHARRARETESPREAREHLETAREAAATLEETGF